MPDDEAKPVRARYYTAGRRDASVVVWFFGGSEGDRLNFLSIIHDTMPRLDTIRPVPADSRHFNMIADLCVFIDVWVNEHEVPLERGGLSGGRSRIVAEALASVLGAENVREHDPSATRLPASVHR